MILVLPPGAGQAFERLAARCRRFLFRLRTAARAARAGWKHPDELSRYIAPGPPIAVIEAVRTVFNLPLEVDRSIEASHYEIRIPIHAPLFGRAVFRSNDPRAVERWMIDGDVLNLECGTKLDGVPPSDLAGIGG